MAEVKTLKGLSEAPVEVSDVLGKVFGIIAITILLMLCIYIATWLFSAIAKTHSHYGPILGQPVIQFNDTMESSVSPIESGYRTGTFVSLKNPLFVICPSGVDKVSVNLKDGTLKKVRGVCENWPGGYVGPGEPFYLIANPGFQKNGSSIVTVFTVKNPNNLMSEVKNQTAKMMQEQK